MPAPEKIGIYGGTFDPVHHGHLILARDAVEQLGLDALHMVVARVSPHKTHTRPASCQMRFEMLQRAVESEAGLIADDTDLRLPHPSYAMDTVRVFQNRFPETKLFYLIGEDHLPLLSTWHQFDQLRAAVEFVVFSRSQSQPIKNEYRRLQRRLDLSASEIRERCLAGLSIRYLLPAAVFEMILSNQLYQETLPSPPTN